MLIHPLPDPVAFTLGPLKVHWYGLMYLVAFLQFLWLGKIRIAQPHLVEAGWKPHDLDNMLVYGVLGVVIGGRLGEVFLYNLGYYFAHPIDILAVWKGGMSFHGGFIGVLIAMGLWSRRFHRSVMETLDMIAPLVPLGYAAGRLGNFINAELPGRLTDLRLPWAMIWPNLDHLPRHPSPIYQMWVDGILLFIILWWYAKNPRPCMAVSGLFALLYGCARFFTEYFRVPDYEVSIGAIVLSAGQVLSVPMVILGAMLLWLAYRE